MVKKIVYVLALMLASAGTAMAGGLLTNTNQNAAFVRQMSQNGIIDLAGVYANPAGTAFLQDGWHFTLNSQTAWQTRSIETEFPLFKANQNNPQELHDFAGKASAPVIPSFSISYNHDKWSLFTHFALGGGGGKCNFNNGLGTFEALYAGQIFGNPTLQGAIAGANATYGTDLKLAGYSMDSRMSGTSYHFGLTLGGTYKLTENVALAGGVRFVYAYCKYDGYVRDVKALAASASGNPAAAPVAAGVNTALAQAMATKSIAIDCKQRGFDVTPILGIDWKINDKWNVAAKYEFKTGLKLENNSDVQVQDPAIIEAGAETLGKFADGAEIAEDIPAILTLGAMYKPLEDVRLMAGWNYYFDKAASKYDQSHRKIYHNTYEFNFGAEYDICKWLTLSASWQTTQYGLSDAYMTDLSFNISNHMVGAGVRVKCCKKVSVDLGYMHTFYGHHNVETQLAPGMVKKDFYNRKNDVMGIGVNVNL